VVAAAVLGVGVVTALTALDTMLAGANEATHQASATCAVRAEASVLEAAAWQSDYRNYPLIGSVSLSSTPSGDNTLQVLEITSTNSAGRVLARATVLKASVLSGNVSAPLAGTSPGAWCSYVLRASP
jgi:hypothetical protein